ncbi:hypothetical protein Mapa_005202 [Marchantia paleacea]|nr:hypothetical protein Mapa_005202 [Marchantia paleacea]
MMNVSSRKSQDIYVLVTATKSVKISEAMRSLILTGNVFSGNSVHSKMRTKCHRWETYHRSRYHSVQACRNRVQDLEPWSRPHQESATRRRRTDTCPSTLDPSQVCNTDCRKLEACRCFRRS